MGWKRHQGAKHPLAWSVVFGFGSLNNIHLYIRSKQVLVGSAAKVKNLLTLEKLADIDSRMESVANSFCEGNGAQTHKGVREVIALSGPQSSVQKHQAFGRRWSARPIPIS